MEPDAFTFYNIYFDETHTDNDKLLIVVYYAFTTLSTVGFGDYHPKSDVERLVASFILVIGVAVFSFIMGNFIEILLNYKAVTAENGNQDDLTKWLGLLARFNKGRPLNKELTLKIE
jgi:hypothetical protein